MQSVEDTSIVVPARSYIELMRVLRRPMRPVDIMLAPAKSQVIFHVEGTELVSRLIDGQFPNYQQVLPASYARGPWWTGTDLLKAVRLSALIACSAANVVKLRVGDEGNPRASRSRPPPTWATPRARWRRSIEGDPVTIAFNARYLVEALQNVEGDQLALEMSGPLLPGVLKPVDDPDYVHVIMPVRTPS